MNPPRPWWCFSGPVRVPDALYWAKEIASALYTWDEFEWHGLQPSVLNNQLCTTQDRIIRLIRSYKQKTKENAPGHTVAQLKSYWERHRGRLKVHSQETYLHSQPDCCRTIYGKIVSFKQSYLFFWTHSTLQNVHTYTEKIVEYNYTISLLRSLLMLS